MNILLISPTSPPVGGIATWTETIIDYCENCEDLTVFNVNTSNLVSELNKRNKFDRYFGSLCRTFKAKREISRLLKDKHIDVAHITTSSGWGTIRDIILLKYLKKKSIPSVYHLHYGRYMQSKLANNKEHKLMRKSLSLADKILAINEDTFMELLKDYSNVEIVPNPIKEVPYSYSDKKTIIFLGYIVPQKGIDEIMSVWDDIYKTYPDWNVDLYGQGSPEYINTLKQRHSNERIKFCGQVSHEVAMDRLMNASIFVLPSYTEGFPYSVCEAMFAGKAIVGSDVGAIPYLLSGNCGIVCKKQDTGTLKSAITELIEHENVRYDLAQNARKKARETFAVPVVMKKYIKIWDELAGTKAGKSHEQ
jgi:glycosyltransferase involved in cell wall biosynthesis